VKSKTIITTLKVNNPSSSDVDKIKFNFIKPLATKTLKLSPDCTDHPLNRSNQCIKVQYTVFEKSIISK
jgi:hypothetical protein